MGAVNRWKSDVFLFDVCVLGSLICVRKLTLFLDLIVSLSLVKVSVLFLSVLNSVFIQKDHVFDLSSATVYSVIQYIKIHNFSYKKMPTIIMSEWTRGKINIHIFIQFITLKTSQLHRSFSVLLVPDFRTSISLWTTDRYFFNLQMIEH
jgi:hypothetical protein